MIKVGGYRLQLASASEDTASGSYAYLGRDLYPVLFGRGDVFAYARQLLHWAQSLPLWDHVRHEGNAGTDGDTDHDGSERAWLHDGAFWKMAFGHTIEEVWRSETVGDLCGRASALLLPAVGTRCGASFVTGKKFERTKPLGFLNQDGAESVWMEQRFKLISSTRKGKGDQLYDIIADPGETKNLASQNPDKSRRMKAALTEWKTAVMAELELIP